MLKNRLMAFLPKPIFHIFLTKYEGRNLFEESDDLINEVIGFTEILEENFVPETLSDLYLNIPVEILDYNQLVFCNQSKEPIQPSQGEDFMSFDFATFSEELKAMIKAEQAFYLQVS